MSWHPYQIHIFYDVLSKIFKRCREALPNETAGYLIGRFCKWNEKYYTLITNHIPTKTISSPTYFSLDPKGFAEVLEALEKKHPNEVIVGWYHSHPGHGVFLSEIDLITQRTFFNESYHVALVVDPLKRASPLGIEYKFFKLTRDGNGYVQVSHAVWRRVRVHEQFSKA